MRLLLAFLFTALTLTACGDTDTMPNNSITWHIDSTERIDGNPVTVLGNPEVISTPDGDAVWFDGVDDGLFLDVNPLVGAEEFTYEVVFRPDSDAPEAQRFFHLQENGTDNRYLFETRLTEKDWYFDAFIASADTNKALIDPEKLHPLDAWHSVAMTYDGTTMRNYVNGVEELSAVMDFAPLGPGRTSIGVRINEVFWFKGAIRTARFTRSVLTPDKMLMP
jgi:hypothetical protein